MEAAALARRVAGVRRFGWWGRRCCARGGGGRAVWVGGALGVLVRPGVGGGQWRRLRSWRCGVRFVRVSMPPVWHRARCRRCIRVIRVAAFVVVVGVGGVERGFGMALASHRQSWLLGHVVGVRGIGVKQAA